MGHSGDLGKLQKPGAVNTANDTRRPSTGHLPTWQACAYQPCADNGGGFYVIPKQTPWNKKYCCDDCRAMDKGFESAEQVKKVMSNKRRHAKV